MKRKTTKATKAPAPVEFHKLSLQKLIVLYDQFWTSIAGLCRLTDYGEPLDFYIQNRLVAPLDKALFACHDAIKAMKPEKGRQTEERAALLYQHALRFDGSDNERRQILAQGMLAIPASAKSERIRFRKSKFGEGVEMHIIKDGDREIWRQWTPASELKQIKRQAKQKHHAAKA